jgi:branched-chain amino acid transport system substrate-binding protein
MRRATWSVLIALAVLAAAGPAVVAAQTIKVGAVVPLTGRYGGGGAQVRAGYEIAIEYINAAGGISIGGKKMPLELILLDDESDATKTVSRLETLASQDVIAYLGGFGSDLHAAAASVAEKNKIPYLGVAFALRKIHEQGFHYLFSPFWKSPDIGEQLVGFLGSFPAAERVKSVAIFQEKTDWGAEMGRVWVDGGRTAGYQVVVQAEYAPGAKDFSDAILKAKSAGATRRHDHGQADEGAQLHAEDVSSDPRRRCPHLVEEPGEGRRLRHPGPRLALRREGAGRERAQ